METKTCSKCGECKSIYLFAKSKDRIERQCAFCKNIAAKAWRDANKERVSLYNKMNNARWYAANKGRLAAEKTPEQKTKDLAKLQAWKIKNPDRQIESSFAARAAKPELYREHGRKAAAKSRVRLSDHYVRECLAQSFPRELITLELIKLHRTRILITRKLKELK